MSPGPEHLYRPRLTELEARQVTPSTLEETAAWCGGTVMDGKGIGLWTHRGFAVAGPMYWIVRHFHGDFGVWEPPEFRENFEPVYPPEEDSRFQGWLGYNFPDREELYSAEEMEQAYRAGHLTGAHYALCWAEADAPGRTPCDRRRDHKTGHSWELAGSLTPTERLRRAASQFMDMIKAEDLAPEVRAKIAYGAGALAHESLAALLVAVNEAAAGNSGPV